MENDMLMKPETPAASNELYIPGENCWTVARAEKAALRIDCANYFESLYHALTHAKHSIFILGWDIDSRIELLRGKDSPDGKGVPLFKVIHGMACANPDLKIYLNKWNYSIFFAKEREPFCGFKWHFCTPKNVFFCSDYNIQFSGCHHQKVIIVDDEIAFCGGMDIALGRWDRRQHYVDHHHDDIEHRVDPGGLLTPFKKKPYGPYHDIMMMVYGPVVKNLAELVRERWRRGAGFDPIPVRDGFDHPGLWPDKVAPHFHNIEMAIARTLPRTRRLPCVEEIQKLYIDEISQAEKFIYIENQYLTYLPIAQAINRRLKERPSLRVLAVSSDCPRGMMEHKSQWTGRVTFCDVASAGIEHGRFVVTYPISREGDNSHTVHIHSKLMIVDDKSLHIGSSNLNNRSMGFDTECDLAVQAKDDYDRARISALRDNLIREHTGRKEQDIEDMIENGASLNELLEYKETSRQHLIRIDNEPFRDERFARLGIAIGDPKQAHYYINLPVRQIIMGICILVASILAGTFMFGDRFTEFFSGEALTNIIAHAKGSHWGFLTVICVYTLAGCLFFPLTVLNLATAVTFGPVYGLIYALAGSLSSAALSYGIGFFAGERLMAPFRGLIEKVKRYARQAGVTGMTLVRLVPIAPFTLVNLTFGVSKIAFGAYMLAAALGLLPGIVVKALFGGALGEAWRDPDPKNIAITIGCLALWIGVMVVSQKIGKRYNPELT